MRKGPPLEEGTACSMSQNLEALGVGGLERMRVLLGQVNRASAEDQHLVGELGLPTYLPPTPN